MTAIDMEVDAFLADSAETVNGKLYALGIGWNTIFSNQFPAAHPRIALGITVHVPFTATNTNHRLNAFLRTEDGEKLALGMRQNPVTGSAETAFELGAEFNIGRPPALPAGDEQVVALSMVIDQLTFAGPGALTWVIEIDGQEKKTLPMRVSSVIPGMLR